jgi:hypothetical protein
VKIALWALWTFGNLMEWSGMFQVFVFEIVVDFIGQPCRRLLFALGGTGRLSALLAAGEVPARNVTGL